MHEKHTPWLHLPEAFHPRTPAEWQDWHWQLSHCISDPRVVQPASRCAIPGNDPCLAQTVRVFPMRVTPYYLSLAKTFSREDPVFRQIIPSAEELGTEALPEDGLGEHLDSPLPGLVHRYPDRALVLLTGACATLCRHCFRKRFWRVGKSYPEPDGRQVLEYIRAHTEISEVIFSGGDALLFPERQMLDWLDAVASIAHVSAIRLASRLPVVLPQRIDKALCRAISQRAPVWLMTQFNHPAELTPASAEACDNLVSNGIPVMNQTVLLKGINDDAEILKTLFQGLVALRVKPHYLFHGDPVAGTGHFRTGIDAGLRIMKALRGRISGLAMPRFAIDLPEGGGKIPLEPEFSTGEGFEAIDGRIIPYF